MDTKLGRFLRDWSGIACHLHAEGNEGRHDAFLEEFYKFEAAHVVINAKVYTSEKIFSRHISNELGLPQLNNIRGLESKLKDEMKESFKCVFVVTNAEDLSKYSAQFLSHFLRLISTTSRNLKLITLSILPWKMIESRMLNFRTSFSTIVCQLPDFTKDELSNMSVDIKGVSQRPTDPMSVKSLIAYLPKNLNPVFLRRFVVSRNLQGDSGSFQRLPSNVALTLIGSYLATWNPASTDQRFFGEKGTGRRRANVKRVKEFKEATAKQFTVQRLGFLYDALKNSLLATKCGNFQANAQIPILLQFGHLEQVSDSKNLIQPKFRCSAPLDYVEKIFNEFVKKHTVNTGKSTGDELRHYLYDYNE